MARLTLFLPACPYDTVKQKYGFFFISEGIIKKFSYERRDYESADENSLS